MRSTDSQAPGAAMAVLGVLALLMLAAAILAVYLLGPREAEEGSGLLTATASNAPPPLPTDINTTVPSNTPVPTPTVSPTSTATSAPTQAPTATPTTASPSVTPVPPTQSVAVNVFFVALGDNGASGLPVGCGDSLIAVPHDIPAGTVTERIAAALTELFSVKDPYVEDQRYYNALYQSNFVVDGVTLDGTTAVVELSGDYTLGDDCNRPRIEAQIEGTISDFAEVDAVQVFVNGTPLETILYGRP